MVFFLKIPLQYYLYKQSSQGLTTVFVMESGTTITSVGATSVLDNDSDPDGDALTAVKLQILQEEQ